MNYEYIETSTITAIILMVIIGMAVPLTIAAIWKIKTKEPISTIFIGAVTFILFAIILESIPKVFLFQVKNPISDYIANNKWVFVIVPALLAGIFEESGRFAAFKFLLKKRKNKKILFPIAILLHTFIDIFAGLYQTKLVTNLIIIEGLVFVISIIIFSFVYKKVYEKQ